MSKDRAIALVFLSVVTSASFSCESGKPLDAHRVLGSSLESVIERWGEPMRYTADPNHERGHGFASWKNVQGARITAFSKMDKVIWVTYRFPEMEPFDEAEAFRLINLDPDPDQANHLKTPGAKRWSPFEKYQKLTVSPMTKMVALGRDLMNRKQAVVTSTADTPNSADEIHSVK